MKEELLEYLLEFNKHSDSTIECILLETNENKNNITFYISPNRNKIFDIFICGSYFPSSIEYVNFYAFNSLCKVNNVQTNAVLHNENNKYRYVNIYSLFNTDFINSNSFLCKLFFTNNIIYSSYHFNKFILQEKNKFIPNEYTLIKEISIKLQDIIKAFNSLGYYPTEEKIESLRQDAYNATIMYYVILKYLDTKDIKLSFTNIDPNILLAMSQSKEPWEFIKSCIKNCENKLLSLNSFEDLSKDKLKENLINFLTYKLTIN